MPSRIPSSCRGLQRLLPPPRPRASFRLAGEQLSFPHSQLGFGRLELVLQHLLPFARPLVLGPLPLGEGRVRGPGPGARPDSGALTPALSRGERGSGRQGGCRARKSRPGQFIPNRCLNSIHVLLIPYLGHCVQRNLLPTSPPLLTSPTPPHGLDECLPAEFRKCLVSDIVRLSGQENPALWC